MLANLAGGAGPFPSLLVLQCFFRDLPVQADDARVEGLILGCPVHVGLDCFGVFQLVLKEVDVEVVQLSASVAFSP